MPGRPASLVVDHDPFVPPSVDWLDCPADTEPPSAVVADVAEVADVAAGTVDVDVAPVAVVAAVDGVGEVAAVDGLGSDGWLACAVRWATPATNTPTDAAAPATTAATAVRMR